MYTLIHTQTYNHTSVQLILFIFLGFLFSPSGGTFFRHHIDGTFPSEEKEGERVSSIRFQGQFEAHENLIGVRAQVRRKGSDAMKEREREMEIDTVR